MALRMYSQTLLAAEFHLHRLLENPGSKGGMVLYAHVFLAAEPSANEHAVAMHLFWR